MVVVLVLMVMEIRMRGGWDCEVERAREREHGARNSLRRLGMGEAALFSTACFAR
jgi:hypothetical protein